MRKTRRILLAVPALAIALATGGCGQNPQPETTAETTAKEEKETTEAETSGQEAPASEKADNAAAAELLTTTKTTQYFTDDPVPDTDIEQILAAGINTTSGMNQQPWHFTAVSDHAVLQEIADEMSRFMPGAPAPSAEGTAPETTEAAKETKTAPSKAQIADAPLAIILSCREGSELDAGLACQSMFVEAKLLGYGAKIISSPTIVLNGENQAHYKELLGIPEDQAAAAVLLVGMEDTSIDSSLDGYTGASVRSTPEDLVTYMQ